MLVVLLLYTTFPTRCGREYKEVVVNVFDGPPSGLHERANVVHRNSIIGASHMIVDDYNTGNWVNTRPRKIKLAFALLKNRDENSKKAELGKNTKN